MYPWNVLGINETDDKKAIKKAYAKLIRLYRPDEAPEKFQEINQAYQFALDSKSESSHYFGIRFNERNTELNKSIVEDTGEEETLEYKLTKSNIDSNFKKDKTNANLIQSWSFLPEKIYRLSFKERDNLAKDLFLRCFEINNAQINETGEVFLSSKIMQYFDDQLSWSERWNEFTQLFDDKCLALNFQLIHDSKNDLDFGCPASFVVRLKVLIFDLLIVLSVFTVSDYLLNRSDASMFVFVYFVYQIIILLLIGKESLGYWYYQIKSVDYQFEPTLRRKKLERIFLFHCSISPIYYLIGFRINDSFKDEFLSVLMLILVFICIVFLRKIPVEEMTDSKVLRFT